MELKRVEQQLIDELFFLIESTQKHTHSQLISSVTILFWPLGKRVNEYILQYARAEYGKQIVVTLSRQLVAKYGRNFEEKKTDRFESF